MRHALLASSLLLSLTACSTTSTSRESIDELAAWMTGSFSSAAQAAADPEYRDIRLHMAPIRTSRADGRWLYVEQAVAEKQEKPYRQRVHRDEHGLVSDVYELPGNPLDFAGAWNNTIAFEDV